MDNNLSVLVPRILQPHFPESKHVFELGLETASDEAIWLEARNNFDAILSKDKDFYHKILLRGSPPKLILINTGNIGNKDLFSFLRQNTLRIKEFLGSKDDILTLYKD